MPDSPSRVDSRWSSEMTVRRPECQRRLRPTHGVTAPTARKWLGRYLAGGEAALGGRLFQAGCARPRAIAPGKALLIVELRRRRMLQAQHRTQRGRLGVHRQPRAGPSRAVQAQRPASPSSRCSATSTRRPATCCTSTPRSSGASCGPATASPATGATRVDGAGWETLFVAIDDHARIAFTAHAPRREEAAGRAVPATTRWPTTPSWACASSGC